MSPVGRATTGALSVVVLHSVFGLRPVELDAAERLRDAGHRAVAPDLFAGEKIVGSGGTPTLDEGFALMRKIGWSTILDRARHALRSQPPDAALLGFSMGVGVISSLWPHRLDAAGVILLHAVATVPRRVPAGTPIQAHLAEVDPLTTTEDLAAFRRSAEDAGVAASLRTYPGAGHFYSDRSLPDYHAEAAEDTWRAVLALCDDIA